MSSKNINTSERPSRDNALPIRQGRPTSTPSSNPKGPARSPAQPTRTSTAQQTAATGSPAIPPSTTRNQQRGAMPDARPAPNSNASVGSRSQSTKTSTTQRPTATGSSSSTKRNQQGSAMPGAWPNTGPESYERSAQSVGSPFMKGEWQNIFYDKLAKVVAARKPGETPRIIVITDIEHNYDDLLAIIFLAEMHRMGAVTLAGFIANHAPAERRAKFLRTVLGLLGLPNVPVAVGTGGTEDAAKHVHNHFYGLRNETFEQGPWNEAPFPRGDDLIEKLARVRHCQPLTMLLLSSLQDIGEFFSNHRDSTEVLKPRYQTYFRKFVSQGGYTVGQDRSTGKLVLTPVKGARNNSFHPTQAGNYYNSLAKFDLPSDAWTREVAKAASLPCGTIQELFYHGPIGEHLRWVWHRQEFKVFWDSLNLPSTPHRNFDWYLTTRLGLTKGDPEFNHLKEVYSNSGGASMRFNIVAPWINVHAYDCCAAVGAVGDDFMCAMGVLGDVPDYNRSHQHRIFGRGPNDLGGINGHQLSQVLQAFLLGGLKATNKIATLKYNPKASPYSAEHFLKTILPWMQKLERHKEKAKKLNKAIKLACVDAADKTALAALTDKAKKEQASVRECEEKLCKIVGKGNKLPTRDDVPYEQLYQLAVKTYLDRQGDGQAGTELSRQWCLTVN